MLAHRLRRWANIKPTLGQRLVFAWKALAKYLPVFVPNRVSIKPGSSSGQRILPANSRGSICLLYKRAGTAFWISGAPWSFGSHGDKRRNPVVLDPHIYII